MSDWRVESFEVSEQDSAFTRIRAIQHPEEYVPPGKYERLMRGNTVVMSTTPMEYRTHAPIIHRAKGIVLLNGLGLGFVLGEILKKPEVQAVTVVEIEPTVIDLIKPRFANDSRVNIVNADAFTFKPTENHYDAVWHDIWTNICSDNLAQMTKLKRKYGKRCDWQGCWSEGLCRRYT